MTDVVEQNLMQRFHYLENPDAGSIASTAEGFLQQLQRPTCLFFQGRDTTRTRAVVTLLHGNEPSGFRALHRWIKSGRQPAVNIVCVIASVEAALQEPVFSNRVLPEKRDLNRCFRQPFDIDTQGQLADDILQLLQHYQPEAVVDIHNTSGSGPSFGVAIYVDDKHDALTSLFTQRLIVTDLRLGSLMEISEHLFPTVTIECGGRLDDEAHEIAWEGINRYFMADDVLKPQATEWGLEVLHNPVRLELTESCRISYAEGPQADADLTLKPDIEHHNFGVVAGQTFLGWVNTNNLRQIFVAKNKAQQCVLDELVMIRDGQLLTKQPLKLFMITTNPAIAKMDCLFYAVKSDGQEIVV